MKYWFRTEEHIEGGRTNLFESERCTFNSLQKKDYADVEKIYTNPKVREFLGGVRQVESIRRTFAEMLCTSQDTYHWIIREKYTENMIGLVSLDLHHEGVNQEISYQFLPAWWGKGYATEVISTIIDFAINELKLSRVIAETQTANKASSRLLEKVGMQKERTVIRFEAEQAIYSISKLQSLDKREI